jgi:hypothetical protein
MMSKSRVKLGSFALRHGTVLIKMMRIEMFLKKTMALRL